MLLIDRVDKLVPGVSAIGYKGVTYNEPFFQGHYPDYPVMPGVLIIEAIAQTGAVALMSSEEYKSKLVFFGGINKAKFRNQVKPGCILRLETELIKIKGPIGIGQGKAYVEDVLAAEAEFTFIIK
jgi:3-hydroxyacyl-[acyl-carrier-protein] dehydratase